LVDHHPDLKAAHSSSVDAIMKGARPGVGEEAMGREELRLRVRRSLGFVGKACAREAARVQAEACWHRWEAEKREGERELGGMRAELHRVHRENQLLREQLAGEKAKGAVMREVLQGQLQSGGAPGQELLLAQQQVSQGSKRGRDAGGQVEELLRMQTVLDRRQKEILRQHKPPSGVELLRAQMLKGAAVAAARRGAQGPRGPS